MIRDVVLLAIGDRALGMELMGAVHVAVIGSQDHDGPVPETGGVQLRQHRRDVAVYIAQTIQIVVVAPAPASILVRNLADERIVRAQEIAMRGRPAGCV